LAYNFYLLKSSVLEIKEECIIRKKQIFFTLLFLVLSMSFVTPVLAQGLFDKECPECHGTGKVACDDCDATGNIVCTDCQGTSVVTCDRCDGSGTITTTVNCPTCYGSGEIEPSIIKKDMNGWGTLVGLDWVARVEGTFHNEEDQGTYGKATSKVTTLTNTYYYTSPRTYFPPHTDVKITIDTPEIEFLEDWSYTIYISSVDDITCPDCGGSGAKSVVTSCPDCYGIGTVDCPDCDGTGQVDCPDCNGVGTELCLLCNGSGYVSDPTKLWTVAGIAIVVIAIVGASAFAITRRKKPKPEVKT